MSTTVITVVLLQNCVDLRSGELRLRAASSEVGNEVIHVQVEGVTEVTGRGLCANDISIN